MICFPFPCTHLSFAPEGSSSVDADLGYFNVPWSGVRRSNLPFVLEPNPVTGQLSFDDPDTVDYCPLCPWGNDEPGGPQDIGNGQCARDSLKNLKGFTTFGSKGLFINRATSSIVTTDSCPSSGTSHSDQCFTAESQHAVNCCSGSASEGTLQCSRPGCFTGQKMNFMDAEALCESNSMRLCTVAELKSNACCSQGVSLTLSLPSCLPTPRVDSFSIMLSLISFHSLSFHFYHYHFHYH